jgi:hypothetical protein
MSTVYLENNSRCTILSLIGRGPASAQIAHLARNIAQAELQRRQLIEATQPIFAHVALTPALEQVVKMRVPAGAGV